MNGSGCKNCPVKNCETMRYRGSTCAAQREKLGLGDPQTNYDRIHGMNPQELAILLYRMCVSVEFCDDCPARNNCPGESVEAWEKWLEQPVEREVADV